MKLRRMASSLRPRLRLRAPQRPKLNELFVNSIPQTVIYLNPNRLSSRTKEEKSTCALACTS